MKPQQHRTPLEMQKTPGHVVQWAHALTQLHERIAAHFARPEPRRWALAYPARAS